MKNQQEKARNPQTNQQKTRRKQINCEYIVIKKNYDRKKTEIIICTISHKLIFAVTNCPEILFIYCVVFGWTMRIIHKAVCRYTQAIIADCWRASSLHLLPSPIYVCVLFFSSSLSCKEEIHPVWHYLKWWWTPQIKRISTIILLILFMCVFFFFLLLFGYVSLDLRYVSAWNERIFIYMLVCVCVSVQVTTSDKSICKYEDTRSKKKRTKNTDILLYTFVHLNWKQMHQMASDKWTDGQITEKHIDSN